MTSRLAMTCPRRKTISTIALAIWLACRCQFSDGEVLFTLEASNANGTPGFLTRTYRTEIAGSLLQINVFAETTETNDTKWLQWTVVAPEDLDMWDTVPPQPNPYIGGSNDFFYPYPMSTTVNYTATNKSSRRVSTDSGPRNRKGLIGIYRFEVTANTALGPRVFRVVDTKAYSTNYNPETFSYEVQPSSGSQITVDIVPNYDSLTNGAKLFMDFNKIPDGDRQVPYLFLDSRVKTPFVLDASTDLTNWFAVKTNELAPNGYPQDFSFRDIRATNFQARFYRSRSIAP